MSNNFLSYYSSYYGYPEACYGKNCIEPNNICTCKTKCNGCNRCNITNPCPSVCPSICPPVCSTICSPVCPNITYITTTPTSTTIQSGGTSIPQGSTSIPINTVTIISGYNALPSTNVGGITLGSNNQFSIPAFGRYFISANVSFASNGASGNVTLYIYKIDISNSIISLLSANSVPLSIIHNCSDTVSTIADLSASDRIFFAATQNSSLPVNTATTNNRYTITRLYQPCP